MIPKVIHQIWIGPLPPPSKLINTWKNNLDYLHILWTEKELETLEMANKDKYNTLLQAGIYYGAADIARVEILAQYGGIYVDADYEQLKPLNNQWLNYNFVCYNPDKENSKTRVGNSFFASAKEHEIILEYRNRITRAKKLIPCWRTIGGTLLTQVLNESTTDSVLILPVNTFYTLDRKNNVIAGSKDNAYARHYMASKNSKIYN